MSLILKTSPIGVDKPIDVIQQALFDGLVTNGEFTDYQSYHRVYINDSEEGIKAERYISKREYNDVFMDDKFALSSFFIVSSKRPAINDGQAVTSSISIIFQAQLDKLISKVSHRADEELNNEIAVILNDLESKGFEFKNMVTGIKNVYAEFDRTGIRYTDMEPFYVVRFDIDVHTDYECGHLASLPVIPSATFTTISSGLTEFKLTYIGGGVVTWKTDTVTLTGQNVTFDLDGTETEISIFVDEPDKITAFNTTAWQNKGIIKMNILKFAGIAGDLRLNTNSMTEFIAPDSSGVFTRLHLYKNDLTIADLRTMILGGDIRVEDQDDLEILLFGASDELVTNLVGDKCSLKIVDLSLFTRLSVIIDFSFNKIENFISGNSAEVILIIKLNNNFLEIFDISGYTKAANEWRWNDNPGLKIVKLPPTTEVVLKIFGFKCDTDYVDYSMIPNLLVGNSTFINIGNCNTGSADIDQMLIDIAAIISVREAPGGDYISRLITINGSNDAPGAAGLAAIATLATFGVSVTATP